MLISYAFDFNQTKLDPGLQLNILMFLSVYIFCVCDAELHFRSMLYAKSLKAFTIPSS